MQTIKDHAKKIIESVIADNSPTEVVIKELENHEFTGNIYLIAIGKAAWTMAKAANDFLGDKIHKGIVVTKYGHSNGPINNTDIYECAHPISDENTILATEKCIALAKSLTADDELYF